MNCRLVQLRKLDEADVRWLLERLSRSGSDFQEKLRVGGLSEKDGTISLVSDQGEIVGWARSETWRKWQTLEAFVNKQYRRRGIATFAAAGLFAAGVFQRETIAVFSPEMTNVAAAVGLLPVLFEQRGGDWAVVP